MSTGALIAFVALLISWSLLSGRLERLDVSGPIIFVVVGLVLCNGPWAVVDVSIETSAVHVLSEITLALLLFADAARINPQDLRHSAGLPIRLLAFGLPLTFAIGFGVAALLFTGLPWELAALLGAVLAPTDAALSASVVSDASLPQSIRRSLNVESGLNDGIATPVVTALIAGSATVVGVGVLEDTASTHGFGALVDLLGGLVIGALVGYLGGLAVSRTRAREWVSPGGARIVALMLAVLAFLAAEVAGVNYFVAAFVAGFAFRTGIGHDDEEVTELPELIGQVLALGVWFVFGAGLLLDGLEFVDWRIALYALLSLTVIRMAARRDQHDGRRLRPSHDRVHRMVRATRHGLGGVRPPDRRGASRRRPCREDRAVHHRPHGVAQRARAWDQRPPAHGMDATPGADGGRNLLTPNRSGTDRRTAAHRSESRPLFSRRRRLG